MTSQELEAIIEQGENSNVEFKSGEVRTDALAREIVAFANISGGVILIGVEDDRSITGIFLERNWDEWVSNIARENVNPQIILETHKVQHKGKSIIVVLVPKGKDKPYQTNEGKFYIRVGSTNRMASVPELMRMFQQSGVFHYDSTPVENTSIQSLNLSKISNYFATYQVSLDALSENEKRRILINSDILSESENTTVAGLLIFGLQPQKYLPNSSISFAAFQGNDLNSNLINKQNIDGSLDYQIDTTLSLIKNLIPVPSTIQGSKRVALKDIYPEKVFRELIVNACCHRNYSILGSKIRVFLFPDRLEVKSPGRLPNTITIEKLVAGVSYAVNPIIVKFMENLNYMDKLGRGLPMVGLEANKLNKTVTFQELGEEFFVALEL